ncbi:MAG TPA: hypothetical protein VFW68_06960 [Rhodocyclaceae bacterium]|nr:hypothetical protein [Rhodocyclaceae bacterium]
MSSENLRQQLRREVSEYLADLRMFGEALQRIEGWIALGVVLAVMAVFAVWFVSGLGFDHLNSLAGSFRIWRPRFCRPLGDFSALVFVLIAIALIFLSAMALGEMMCLLDRVKRKRPAQAQYVAWPVAFMLIIAVAGIVYANSVC